MLSTRPLMIAPPKLIEIFGTKFTASQTIKPLIISVKIPKVTTINGIDTKVKIGLTIVFTAEKIRPANKNVATDVHALIACSWPNSRTAIQRPRLISAQRSANNNVATRISLPRLFIAFSLSYFPNFREFSRPAYNRAMSTYPNEALRAKLKNLPKSPGVYFHKSADGTVIYVGKASNLKNRVSSYFRGEHDTKTEALVRDIATTDWIETDSEMDALFLESEMIKRYMPRYNILLRDDKTSIFVRISFNAEIPTVTTSRTPADDGADYIGPFYSSAELKRSLHYLRKVFPYFAKAQDSYSKLPVQLGMVPDIFAKNPTENQPQIDPTKLADYRKNLRALVRYLRGERVKIQTELTKEMHDLAATQQFEAAAKLRNQLRYLNELKKQIIFGREEFMDISRDQALQSLKTVLNLPNIPRRIEAYDVSHIAGTNVVASMVVATNGVMDRREYRKFKLSRQINDDTANLREVLERRFSPRNDKWSKPDLIILDGGKPQVSAVRAILDERKIPFIGRDKSGDHSGNADMKIIIPLENKAFREVGFAKTSHIAMLIARLDEESHRFAITYHQNLRGKAATKNALEEIPGVGPATRKKLLRQFGSIKQIREQPDAVRDFIGEKLAKKIRENL